MGRTEHLSTH